MEALQARLQEAEAAYRQMAEQLADRAGKQAWGAWKDLVGRGAALRSAWEAPATWKSSPQSSGQLPGASLLLFADRCYALVTQTHYSLLQVNFSTCR
jgi:hypothetical protein